MGGTHPQSLASAVGANKNPTAWRVGRASVGFVLLLAAFGAWSARRAPAAIRFVGDSEPQAFQMSSFFLSGAVGRGRGVGFFDQSQVDAFIERGGTRPASHMDIRDVPSGPTPTVLSRVDPGLCWVLHLASRLGIPLSIASVAVFQSAIDLLCIALAGYLAFRVWGPIAGGMAALLYGANLSLVGVTQAVSYYFWNVPASLIFAHVALTVVRRRTTNRGMFFVLVLFAIPLIWLRVLWLPALAAALTLVSILVFRKRAGLPLIVVVIALALSYSGLIARVSKGTLGDFLHPRSQLWHTLYIGLGAYGDWGAIHWLDDYGYQVAATAGISAHDTARYDEFLKTLFLHEVRARPFKYFRAIVRRAGDYVDECRVSLFHVPALARSAWLGWAMLIAAALTFTVGPDWRSSSTIGAIYAIQIGVWSLFLPPLSPYPEETIGLAYPVLAGVLVTLSRIVAKFIRAARTRNVEVGIP